MRSHIFVILSILSVVFVKVFSSGSKGKGDVYGKFSRDEFSSDEDQPENSKMRKNLHGEKETLFSRQATVSVSKVLPVHSANNDAKKQPDWTIDDSTPFYLSAEELDQQAAILDTFVQLGQQTSSSSSSANIPAAKTIVPVSKAFPASAVNGAHKESANVLGFKNFGNTCFLNATLQALFATPSLVEFLNDGLLRDACDSLRTAGERPVVCILRDLLQDHSENLLRELQISLPKIWLDYREANALSQQQDAASLLIAMIEHLETRFKDIFTFDDFNFQLRSIVQRYRENRQKISHNYVISIPVQQAAEGHLSSLEEGLKIEAASTETTDGGLKISHTFNTLPNILAIHVKRFDSRQNRINGVVPFKSQLDMRPYYRDVSSNDPILYELYAVVVHKGAYIRSGHYYAYVKNQIEAGVQSWMQCDDSTTRPATEEQVLNDEAYIVFYRRATK